eukprot:CAMPEP_0203867660 /NCGR_PEP_ID=MMETSP0359-20131031/16650_1 /ASSEMBLY_ACC=CAM_ASM_000338 /TAXON_ID=268821 /ORGANISM="Scrippsiella Hangoei, Strain SHTV-5" /LENGTH=1314 /DNA_ID=CAMNT_0050785945 /DNA_START=63 /DNA_END=4007 /DNA_ORIENTATION=+
MARIARSALLLCGLAASGQAQEVMVDGSGTTNPSKFFWKIMDTFKAQSRRELRMTYRAVGSGTGQKEFSQVASANFASSLTAFGSGDIPMPQDLYNSIKAVGREMLHVPLCLGAIGIFHSIPAAEVGVDGLKLSPCILAKIFSGQITTWDDVAIKADNPNLAVPAGTQIKVGHRTLGSSSTGGLTGYLTAKCPADWKMVGTGVAMGSSGEITWPASTTAVYGSPGMQDFILDTKYAIGYLDAGHGHQRNIAEAMLKNEDGMWLTSLAAMASVDPNGNNGVAAAGKAAVDASTIPANAKADWSAVNLYSKAGPSTWPIVLVSYLYLNNDWSSMSADEAGLLKVFVDYVVEPTQGQPMLKEFSFDPIPSAMNQWASIYANITKPGTVTAFTFETATAAWTGQGLDFISTQRSDYNKWKLEEVSVALVSVTSRLVGLESSLNDYGIVPLHGSGTTNPKTMFAKTMKNMQHEARVPMLLTYRSVGSGTGMVEFVGDAASGFKSYNHFGSGDIPMDKAKYDTMAAKGETMVHLPFCMGPIGIFHHVPGALLTMDACLLAKIFSGLITTWDHADIKAQNPSLTVPVGQPIKVGHRTLGSSSTGGLAGYLAKTCPASWSFGDCSLCPWPKTAGFTAVQGTPGMQAYIKDTSFSIGYLDAGQGHDFNLREVSIPNKNGKFRTSFQSMALGGVAQAGAEAVTTGTFPTDASADWSAVNVYNMPGDPTWPIVLVSYLYVKKDQTATNPKTAAALKAFILRILNNHAGVVEEFGFTAPPTSVKTQTLAAAATIVYPTGMTSFVEEDETNPIGGMATNVISSKRIAFDDYQRDIMAAQILTLQATVSGLTGNGGITTQVHGSGTTNPKNWFAKAMRFMEDRSRMPMVLTYRAVGSGTGQQEFVGNAASSGKSYNDFGAGDIPMSKAYYDGLMAATPAQAMVHLPFALGAIGIFHNVPSADLGGAAMQLDACTLAKIFSGNITTWDDPAIKAQNPNIKVPANQLIMVGHRTLGSSSTGGLAGYLDKKCKPSWDKGSGGLVVWPTTAAFTAVEGSPGMQTYIKDTMYSIGYLDAGHGHDFNILEVALTNLNGKTRNSKQSIALGGVAEAGNKGIAAGVFPSDASADWSAVDLYDMAGDTTWPIVLVSYMYVKKDQTATDPQTAAALKAFIRTILQNYDNLCQENDFTPPSMDLKNLALAAADTIKYPSGMMSFEFETDTAAYTGMGANTISMKRWSFDDYERSILKAQIVDLSAKVDMGVMHPPLAAPAAAPAAAESSGGDASLVVGIIAIIVSVVSIGVSTFALMKARGSTKGESNASATMIGAGQA